MKALEGIALELFNKFSIKETGKKADWAYLSNERKLEWMKDVFLVAHHVFKELIADFKPLPKLQGNTVYEMAYSEGVRSERVYTQQMIQAVFDKLKEELANMENSIKKD